MRATTTYKLHTSVHRKNRTPLNKNPRRPLSSIANQKLIATAPQKPPPVNPSTPKQVDSSDEEAANSSDDGQIPPTIIEDIEDEEVADTQDANTQVMSTTDVSEVDSSGGEGDYYYVGPTEPDAGLEPPTTPTPTNAEIRSQIHTSEELCAQKFDDFKTLYDATAAAKKRPRPPTTKDSPPVKRTDARASPTAQAASKPTPRTKLWHAYQTEEMKKLLFRDLEGTVRRYVLSEWNERELQEKVDAQAARLVELEAALFNKTQLMRRKTHVALQAQQQVEDLAAEKEELVAQTEALAKSSTKYRRRCHKLKNELKASQAEVDRVNGLQQVFDKYQCTPKNVQSMRNTPSPLSFMGDSYTHATPNNKVVPKEEPEKKTTPFRRRGGRPQAWWRGVEEVGVRCAFEWDKTVRKTDAKGTCACKRLCKEGELKSYKMWHDHKGAWDGNYLGY